MRDRAQVLGRFAAVQFWHGRFGRAIELAREAVEAARESGRPCVRGRGPRDPGRRAALRGLQPRSDRSAERGAPDGSRRRQRRGAPVRDGQPRRVPRRHGPPRGGHRRRRTGARRTLAGSGSIDGSVRCSEVRPGWALFELGRWVEAEATMSHGPRHRPWTGLGPLRASPTARRDGPHGRGIRVARGDPRHVSRGPPGAREARARSVGGRRARWSRAISRAPSRWPRRHSTPTTHPSAFASGSPRTASGRRQTWPSPVEHAATPRRRRGGRRR